MKMSNKERCSRYYYQHRNRILKQRKEEYGLNRDKICEKARIYRKSHPLQSIHIGMLKRCGVYDCDSIKFKYYKGRGITICDEWMSFPVFEKWAMEHGWKKGLQIDRIDNNGNYSPDNCRFVTPKENGRNKRNNRIVIYKGKEYVLSEANELFAQHISSRTIYSRLSLGWSYEEAISKPVRKRISRN